MSNTFALIHGMEHKILHPVQCPSFLAKNHNASQVKSVSTFMLSGYEDSSVQGMTADLPKVQQYGNLFTSYLTEVRNVTHS
jgi:hypothetical protein